MEIKPGQVELKKFTSQKPVRIDVQPPKVKAEAAKPSEAVLDRFRVRLESQKTGAAEALDVTQLENLEKKLKALQDEVDRLKKAARQEDGKK
jgi:hypothetical protein